MPLIDIPIHVITENIKDRKCRNNLQEIKDNNKRLHTEETGLSENVTTTKADLDAYEVQLATIKQNLESAKQSVATVKTEKLIFTHA